MCESMPKLTNLANMRVVRVAGCCELRPLQVVTVSYLSPLLLLLFYCYLLITASFGSPKPSPETRQRTFLFFMHILMVICILWIMDRWIKGAWTMDHNLLAGMAIVV